MPHLTHSTISTKLSNVTTLWHKVDANNKILGRVASEIAMLLTGKNKPHQVDYLDFGDEVVVINAEKVVLTGNKLQDKVYTNYSGYPGGLRSTSAQELLAKKPTEMLKRAVAGMLPKNKLRAQRMKKLHLFAGSAHTYESQFIK